MTWLKNAISQYWFTALAWWISIWLVGFWISLLMAVMWSGAYIYFEEWEERHKKRVKYNRMYIPEPDGSDGFPNRADTKKWWNG
ncbi:MAG: hypothetical protein JWO15_3666 [Sphingomonadales bacterium]|nr:hypothetical protein [Sphingomonadales bacterium]